MSYTLNRLYLMTMATCLCVSASFSQEMREHNGRMMMIVDDTTAIWFDTREPVDRSLFSVVSVNIEPLEDAVDPITEGDLIRIAQRQQQLAEEASILAASRARAASQNRNQIHQKLMTAKSVGDASEAAQLQRQLQLAERIATETEEERLAALRNANRATAVVEQGRHVEMYNLNRRKRRERRRRRPVSDSEQTTSGPAYALAINNFSGYGSARPDPPAQPCALAYEGVDEDSGDYVRLTRSERFFSHTDPSLRPYLEGREYLECHAHIYQVRGFHYLQLEVVFANPNAMTTYGFLPENSVLSLHLLDGHHVNLRAAQAANGSWDAAKGLLSYQVSFPIDRAVVNQLRQSELDFIRLYWSSGFEEYDIYQVSLIQQMLACVR
ncbi:MAG: hypothetical protein AAGF87_05760 [Bacteroidota bacterium]